MWELFKYILTLQISDWRKENYKYRIFLVKPKIWSKIDILGKSRIFLNDTLRIFYFEVSMKPLFVKELHTVQNTKVFHLGKIYYFWTYLGVRNFGAFHFLHYFTAVPIIDTVYSIFPYILLGIIKISEKSVPL